MIATIIDRLTETNPQIMREWQGRLTPKNISIASVISLVGQLLVYLYYQNLLPVAAGFSRYCTANPPNNNDYYHYSGIKYCIQDLNGEWMIISRLWWLDIFTFLSITGIFALLVVGTYQLIADLSGEERRGTLNFIRLSHFYRQNFRGSHSPLSRLSSRFTLSLGGGFISRYSLVINFSLLRGSDR